MECEYKKPVNIGNDEEITINKLVKKFEKIIKKKIV